VPKPLAKPYTSRKTLSIGKQ